jgi:putative addiction module component (TIGR02574 family)
MKFRSDPAGKSFKRKTWGHPSSRKKLDRLCKPRFGRAPSPEPGSDLNLAGWIRMLFRRCCYNFNGDKTMPTIESLIADVASLPIADRIQVIDAIWDTLPPDSLPPLSDEWTAEIRKRSAEYDSGIGETVSWLQIRSEALRRVGVTESDATN